ncbi:MAG: hypothetical protein AB7V74_01830 [Acidimicrobiia bacterium]
MPGSFAIVESYVQGTLVRSWQRRVGARPTGLTVVERRTLRLLRPVNSSMIDDGFTRYDTGK